MTTARVATSGRTRRRGAVAVIVAVLAMVACGGGGGGGDNGGGGGGEQASGQDGQGDGDGGPEVHASTHPDPENLEIVEPPDQPGVERLEFRLGPIAVEPGQNTIAYSGLEIPKPEVDGYIVSIEPNLERADGEVPPVDVLHLHHGVLANATATPEERDWGGGQGELLLAAGTYDIGFVPKTVPEAADLTPARPRWMDDNHGGEETDEFVDATELAEGPLAGDVTIADFTYAPGDIGGIDDVVPTVRAGETLKFTNADAPIAPHGIWHTITSCAPPCDRSTGVAYPLADADVQFDSGELGNAGPPTAGRLEWEVPTDLAPDTYTYLCRIHPSMRGAFRVVD